VSRVHHLDLTVSDMETSIRFYDVVLTRLGFKGHAAEGQAPEWRSASVSIALHAAKRGRGQHDRYTPGLHHLAFNAESRTEVDAFHKFLIAHRIKILDAPAEYDYEPGYYAVFFADPDGMKLELAHTPNWVPR
jgi:catechol 2,3-dioxygenase-like lactoylglutathione lyase family enzyme